MLRTITIVIILICLGAGVSAQRDEGFTIDPDTLPEVDYTTSGPRQKSKLFAGKPGKAALYGFIPGGGQIYNKDYLKLPFVYAAIGGMWYLMDNNGKKYKEFKSAYISRIDSDAAGTVPTDQFAGENCQVNCTNPPQSIPTAEGIKGWRDKYNKWRQQSIFGFGAVYFLTIVEAYVSAHLKNFDVSEDLSMQVRPKVYTDQTTLAFQTGIVINF